MKSTKFLILVFISLFTLISCGKDETINPDFCAKGDLWMFEIYDTISPMHSLDSFKFNQALGIHTFYWASSPVNSISFNVKKTTNDTTVINYNSSLISSLSGVYRGKPFTYDNVGTDTIATISFENGKYVLNLGPISVNYDGGKKTLKACKLLMTDTNP